MATILDIQKILAVQGLAAARAAAGNTTDVAILQLLQHYQKANCAPTTAPIPATSGPRAVSPGSYWYYNPGAQDICSFSLGDPAYGLPAPPDPDPTPLNIALVPAGVAPAIAAPAGSAAAAGLTSSWLTNLETLATESSFIPNVPNWILAAGVAVFLFWRKR